MGLFAIQLVRVVLYSIPLSAAVESSISFALAQNLVIGIHEMVNVIIKFVLL